MRFVALETGVDDIFDIGVFLEEMSDVVGISCGCQYSQFECFERPQTEIAVEGTGTSTESVSCEVNLFSILSILEDESSHDEIRVTSSVFGETMVCDVSPEKEGRADVR